MLAQALLQNLIMHKGLSQDEWSDACSGRPHAMQSLSTRIFANAEEMRGLNMDGDDAFMQLPMNAFSPDDEEPVDGLFQPFFSRRAGSIKTLRNGRGLGGICPCCASIGLYGLNTLSSVTAQYWSSSVLKGSMAYRLQVPRVGQSLMLNVLHDQSLRDEKDMQGFPWCSKPGDGEQLPFERHLTAGYQISHIAECLLPMMRACRISWRASHHEDRCDLCLRTSETMASGISFKGEIALGMTLASETIQGHMKYQGLSKFVANKLLEKVYTPQADHPNVAKVAFLQKTPEGLITKARVQAVDGRINVMTGRRPSWMIFADAIGGALAAPPKVLQQYLAEPDLQMDLRREMWVNVYGVQFESPTNANPKVWIDERCSSNFLFVQGAGKVSIAQSASGVAKVVEKMIAALVDSAERIHWRVDKSCGQFKGVKPQSNADRKKLKMAIQNDSSLINHCNQIWEMVFNQLNDAAISIENNPSPINIASLQTNIERNVKIKTRRIWRQYLNDCASDRFMTLRDFYLHALADAHFMKLNGMTKEEYFSHPTTSELRESAFTKNAKKINQIDSLIH